MQIAKKTYFLIFSLMIIFFMVNCGGGGGGGGSTPTATPSYTTADLAGTWEGRALLVTNGLAEWERATMTIQSDGSFSGPIVESDGDQETITGTLSITSGGIITLNGDNDFNGSMNSAKNFMVFNNTYSGGQEIKVFTKMTDSYTTADLAGTWEGRALLVTNYVAEWERATMTIQTNGSFSAPIVESDGAQKTITGTLSITSGGIVTLNGDNDFNGSMNSAKNLMIFNNTYSGGQEIKVFTKMTDSYTSADLAGTWEGRALLVTNGVAEWERGTMTIQSDGSFSAPIVESDGDQKTITGTFSITSGGIVTLNGDNDFNGSMNSSKNVVIFNNTYSGGYEIKVFTKIN